MKSTIRPLVILWLWMGLFLGQAHASGVGWIDDLTGSQDTVTLVRGGQKLPVKLYGTVQDGDAIHIGAPGTYVKISYGEQHMVKIGASESPYLVKKSGKLPTVAGNLLTWMGNFLGSKQEEQPAQLTALRSRGPAEPIKLRVPDAVAALRLVAGTGPVYLSWSGGESPYSIRLSRDDKVILAIDGIAEGHVLSGPVTLAPGAHDMAISSESTIHPPIRITVVSADLMPMRPAEINASPLPDVARETLYAVWLADRDQGVWILESLRILSKLASSYQPARTALELLERGEDIPRYPGAN